MNPYEPPTVNDIKPVGSVRWIRRLLILNCVLLAFPVSLALFIYGSLKVESGVQPDTINGDPVTFVTYDHEFIGISGPIWPIIVFFVVPNLILLSMFALSARSRPSRSRESG